MLTILQLLTIAKDEHSQMQSVVVVVIIIIKGIYIALIVDELVNWSTSNHMNINSRKTKEMILGPMLKRHQ